MLKRLKRRNEERRVLYHNLPAQEQKIQSGRKYFIIDNISIYIIVTVCSGSYLAGILKFVGIPPEINGIILSIPVLAGLFQTLGAIISQKIHSQKQFVVFGSAVHRICLSLVFIYPLLFGATPLCVVLIIVTYATGYFIGTAVSPASSNWIVNLVPPEKRGGYFSTRERYSLSGVAVATMVASLILDKFKIIGHVALGFAVVGVILMAVTVYDIICLSKIYEPELLSAKKRFTFKALMEPLLDKKFFKVIMVFILWQASVQIAIPFLGIYYIDTIKMDYTIIGVVALIVTAEKILIVSRWGKYADKTSWDNVLKISLLFYATGQALLFFLSSSNFIWLYPVAQIVGSVAWSVLGIALFNLQFQFINPDNATLYIGVCGTVSGLVGFGFAVLGSKILTFVNGMMLSINGYQVLIFLSAIMGFVLSLYIHKKVKK